MITKHIREQAALICAIAASSPDEWFSTIEIGLGEDGWCRASHELAVAAWREASRRWPKAGTCKSVIDAEAEALLRTGWSPWWSP